MTEQYITVAYGKAIKIFRSHPLLTLDPAIDTLVFIVHGSERDGQGKFNLIAQAAAETGNAGRTLIMAPQFAIAGDAVAADEFLWIDEGGGSTSWKTGGDAANAAISSFDVAMRLIRKPIREGYFPNMQRVVITGHSAGGQFAHRFAARTALPVDYPAVEFTFAPANPSSLLYPTADRPAPTIPGVFVVQSDGCAKWNEYHYGLDDPNPYMSLVPAPQLAAQLTSRRVALLLGDQDTARDGGLDISCGADMQGPNRFQRGSLLVDYLDNFYPGHGHSKVIVPDAGHSSAAIYGSAEARAVLWPAT